MTGRAWPLLALGPLVECAQHCERHRCDAGLDGRLRHRRDQRGMVAGKRRAALARGSDALWIVDADIEEHRGHAGIDVLGKILARGDRRRGPELVAEGRLQHLLGGRDNSGIVDDRLDTLADVNIRCRRIRHGATPLAVRSIPSCILARTSGLKVLKVPNRTASSGMMLPAVPAWSEPMETTPNSVGSFSRLITLCTSTTKRDAIITGSMVACGTAPWPPRPLNLM